MWIEIGSIDEFNQNNKKVVKIENDLEILVIKLGSSFIAIENKCSHDEKPLSNGQIIDNQIIECNYHGARFDLQTGKALKMPAVTPINIFKTKIENNKVLVSLD